MIQKARGLVSGRIFLSDFTTPWREDATGLRIETFSLNHRQKNNFALKAFTDNIVLAWPVLDDAESEFGLAFLKLAYFQLQMVRVRFLHKEGPCR